MPLTFHAFDFKIANLSEIPWPTAHGGNTPGPCPFNEHVQAVYDRTGSETTPSEMCAHLATDAPGVAGCWHHRHRPDILQWMAALACWFVAHGLQPTQEAAQAVVVAQGMSRDYGDEISGWFEVPMKWTFTPGDPLSNGRHRACAFKSAGVSRIPAAHIK